MKTYTLKIRFLTPVFVGSGYELDTLSYTAKTENSKSYLLFLDIQKWLQENSSNPKLQDALSRFDYLLLRKLIAEAADVHKFSLYKIEISSSRFNSIYKEILEGKRQEHQLIVELFPRNGTRFLPYLPASSIKGSIRTAIGNSMYRKIEKEAQALCKRDKRAKKEGCYPLYNKLIFGEPSSDAFKYLKISDCILPKDFTNIVEPKEVFKSKKSPTPKNFAEATKSFLSHGRTFEAKTKCVIGDFSDFQASKAKRQIKEFNLEWLIEKINQFYISRYKDELNFYATSELSFVRNQMKNLLLFIEKEISKHKNTALLRVGHFSHIECITWDNRKPKVKKYGTTRTLANGMYPFGWVLISFEQGYKHEHESEKRKPLAEDSTELDTKRIEEQQELSEVERICKNLIDKKDEHYSMEIYWKLDSFSLEDKKQIAQALKECWQAIGKWGKKVSRKQKEKIRKIKDILGEK